jgi:hypothetical protein
MPGGGGDAGIGAFPACKRASSSWFSWSAVLPVNCGALPRWCAAILPWAIWRAWLGGIAEVLSGIAGGAATAEGAIAAGCVDGGMLTPPDAFGPRPPCPGFCAQAGAEKARVVTTATPVRRCFMLLILRCSRILKGRYRRPVPAAGSGGM